MCVGAETFLKDHGDKIAMGATAMDALGKVVGGRQVRKYRDYEAEQAEADADAEQQIGQLRAGRVRKAGARTQAGVRAATAASGIDVGSGSTLAVQEQLDRDVGEDALTELLTGGYRAQSLRATAAGKRAAGRNAEMESYFGAGKSLLAGTSSLIAKRAEEARLKKRTAGYREDASRLGSGLDRGYDARDPYGPLAGE